MTMCWSQSTLLLYVGAQLVLGWMTISVCSQPLRPTQLGHPSWVVTVSISNKQARHTISSLHYGPLRTERILLTYFICS